jgi:hypothetical protein
MILRVRAESVANERCFGFMLEGAVLALKPPRLDLSLKIV